MGDPDLSSGEQILVRTQGVYVKSIPFEGILTNKRIILIDQAKKILPSKEIALATVQSVETGENAIRDHILTISVIAESGQLRQMVLTFSRREGGNRARERDEWARRINESITALSRQAGRTVPGTAPAQKYAEPPFQPPASPQRIPIKRVVETGTYERPAVTPAPVPEPVPQETDMALSGESIFCTRCGNRVPIESVFCNRCGSPVVAPATAQHKPVQQRQYAPSPAAEPVYEQPSMEMPRESPRAPVPQAPSRQFPAQYDGEAAGPAPESRRPAASSPAKKPAKKGLFSRIFSSGKGKPATATPPAPAPERKARRNLMPGKKVLMAGLVVVILIVVVAVGAVFVYPMLSSGALSGILPSSGGSSGTTSSGGSSGSSSASLTNTGVASITIRETTIPTVPATGVWVSVTYIGSFKGSYGMPSDLQKIEDSGARMYEVVNGTGTIQATLEKRDSSTRHALAVAIYKDGKLVKNGETSASYGSVSISADVGGSPVVPAASASATTAAVNGNATVTTKTTTTVKTTTKSS